jgi:hypothetical protein
MARRGGSTSQLLTGSSLIGLSIAHKCQFLTLIFTLVIAIASASTYYSPASSSTEFGLNERSFFLASGTPPPNEVPRTPESATSSPFVSGRLRAFNAEVEDEGEDLRPGYGDEEHHQQAAYRTKPVRRTVLLKEPGSESTSWVAGSTSSPPPPEAADGYIEDSYKSRADWWKDPLAYFDDEQEEEEPDDGAEFQGLTQDTSAISPTSAGALDDDEGEFLYEEEEEKHDDKGRPRAPYQSQSGGGPYRGDQQQWRWRDDGAASEGGSGAMEPQDEEEELVGGDYFDALEELRLPSLPVEEGPESREPFPAIPSESVEREVNRREDPTHSTTEIHSLPPRRATQARFQKLSDNALHAPLRRSKKRSSSRGGPRGEVVEATSSVTSASTAMAPSSSSSTGGAVVVTAVPAFGLAARLMPLRMSDFFANQSGILQAIGALLLVKQVVQGVWPHMARARRWGTPTFGFSPTSRVHVQTPPHSRGGGMIRTASPSRRAKNRRSRTPTGDVSEAVTRPNQLDEDVSVDDEEYRSPSLDQETFTDVAEEDDEEHAYREDLLDLDTVSSGSASSNAQSNDLPETTQDALSTKHASGLASHGVHRSYPSGGSLGDAFRRVLFGIQPAPPQHLMDRIQELTDRCNQLDRLKCTAEGEYERVNVQLQQAQTELSTLKQTTRYLQAQLRDNEEMMEKVVKSERRKAKAELARMKESMLQIVEREREAMREEFQKQAAELERMLLQEREHHLTGPVNFTETAVYQG